ncbi:YhdH/YhfP family quinone oxidoreductase [Epilithonimonas sp. JDS]|uniref:YhdH/YhfP family quinone oxidoreductase n=1 Tax=Epilithonimonas sp. JDS TaxID=2902797 RepID=UPI001E5E2CC1|nr:YhdH/YhfP family quinone oxidoreductase [Epilithonimonas sp. JDS]MCD9855169.1 YhdH/YhfP family quinone oxidoreductase [Epilithonimonas sp. JDS]
MSRTFRALMVRESEGVYNNAVEEVPFSEMVENEVLIEVEYSSVNYKDALSASGNKGVTREFPHIPGIDAAGKVVSSKSGLFKEGDSVIVTGYDLGMNTWGGFGQYISVPAGWVIRLPHGLTPFEAMCYGTAGLTAGISVFNLIKSGLTPDKGKIVVSGATGGVGSISTAILARIGYDVVAISGKNNNDYIKNTLGASEVISREDFTAKYDARAMSATDFAGGIDCVGGKILSGMIKSLKYGGAVTCCGNVASGDLATSIYPFILRGIRLIGIDSVEQPLSFKEEIWSCLADDFKPDFLSEMVQVISIEDLPDALETILKGGAEKRFVVKH